MVRRVGPALVRGGEGRFAMELVRGFEEGC